MNRFDLSAGHIAIANGDMPLFGIDWASLVCEPHETFADALGEHMLVGIEPRGIRLGVDIYVMQSDLKLHTDITMHPGQTTYGLIIEADDDLVITSGRSNLTARPGDVYSLDPNKQHGTRTSGFLAFATQDYHPDRAPTPDEFRAIAITEIVKLLEFRNIRYQSAG